MQDDAKIVIRLRGEPVPKGRHRSRIQKAKSGGMYVQEYADPTTAKYESHLRYAAQRVMAGRLPLAGPLVLTVEVYRSIPSSMPAWRQFYAREGGEDIGEVRPTTKPDLDNYAKVKDALNKLVWRDDGQIVDEHLHKFYSDIPELVIVVEELREPTIDDYRALMRSRKGALPDAPQLALPAPETVS